MPPPPNPTPAYYVKRRATSFSKRGTGRCARGERTRETEEEGGEKADKVNQNEELKRSDIK